MAEKFKPSVGKNVIETLTMGMYDDPRFIFREYVQNSADQIDAAVNSKLFNKLTEGEIHIVINKSKRQIIIEDNATGIETKKAQSLLGDIAQSTKDRYSNKGFRGIGRLGGLGYCNRLTFQTSYKGEKLKSLLVWDAKQLRQIISNSAVKIEASELISAITNFYREPEKADESYFKVIMEEVSNERLLEVEEVREYLSMVAPVPFSNIFSFKTKIYAEAKSAGIALDEYKIFINGDQLFKAYKNSIFNNKSKIDEIIDVDVFKEEDENENGLLYWGWYGVSKKMQQIPEENIERFIRLRKNNIQIGLDNRLDSFHKKAGGNIYFIGEVHAVNKDLIPNARRDFFEDNVALQIFERKLRSFFHTTLHNLYYDFSRKNSSFNDIEKFEKVKEDYLLKAKEGFVSKQEEQELSEEVEKKEKKAKEAKAKLYNLYEKYETRALGKVIAEKIPVTELRKSTNHSLLSKDSGNKNFKVDNIPKLSESEKRLLAFIYEVIKNVQSDKMSKNLIAKIEEELNEKYTANRAKL
jgi:molecular chaperone HtpG